MLGAAAGFDGNDPASLTASVPDYLANLDAGRYTDRPDHTGWSARLQPEHDGII